MKRPTKAELVNWLKYWRPAIEKNAGNWIYFDLDWQTIQKIHNHNIDKYTWKYLKRMTEIFYKYI